MDFVSARTKHEALDCLDKKGDETSVIAGGTDVMVQLGLKQLSPAVLLHVERLSELTQLNEAETIRIGSLITQRSLAESELVSQKLPSLRSAASLSGGWQTQSVGTIGGNVCNASPAADLIPVLLAHDATVTLESKARGERRLPIGQFVLGRRKIAREKDELLTSFELPRPGPHSGCAFAKVGRRSAMEISVINVAVRMLLKSDGTVSDAAIAVGSAGPVAFRAVEAENLIKGEHLDDDLIAEAAQRLLDRATPIDDVRGSQTYRRNVLPRIFERCLRQAAELASRTVGTERAH